MKPKLIYEVKNGSKPGQVMIKSDNFALETLSASAMYSDGKILIADNELKRFQVLSADGEVELIISAEKAIDSKQYSTANFNFSRIGVFNADRSGNLYIQNRISGGARGGASREDMDFSPSYILVFSDKGKLEHTLGQTGTPDIPFYHIEYIETDSDGRVLVVSRSFESWNLYVFSGKKRDYHHNLSNIDLSESVSGETYKGIIENVRTMYNGEYAVISVAYYHGLRLKHRKVFEYSIPEGKVTRTLMTMPDPKNVLFNIVDDKLLYFWNVENNEVKFMISDLNGSVLNNLKLTDGTARVFYSKYLCDRKGQFYSYQISRTGMKIFEWE
jgi:hypothetical protein